MTGAGGDEQGWDAYPPEARWDAPSQGWGPPPPGEDPSAGAQPYPAAAWGQPQPGWWAPPTPSLPFPRGNARPGSATAAAVLGLVAGGLAILWGLVGIVLLAGADGGSATWLGVVVGLPAGIALILGGIRLLARADRWFVVGGGAALALTVLAQAVVSAANSYGAAVGQATLVVLLLPVPTVAAVLAGLPVVGGWIAAGSQGAPPPTQPGW